MNQSLNENIEKVKAILNIVGSPFDKSQNVDMMHFRFDELYEIAQRNKIGLLFLESASKEKSVIFSDELQDKLENQLKSYRHLLSTVVRAATILNKIECKYAIIKSIMPFHAIPNDVDIIVLGNTNEYINAVEHMKANNFEPLGEEKPLEICLHDSSKGVHINPSIKDPFDVDIYKEIGASYIIYMNKTRLVNQIDQITIDNARVNILKTSSELALSIFHSIFPERIYTLLLHFYILHTVKQMSSLDIDNFLQICHEQHISNAALVTLTITELIQETCFGTSPNKIIEIRESLGKRKSIDIDSLPYKYPLKAILGSFWNKKKDPGFSISFVRQLFITLSNPKITKHVLAEYSHRRKRKTY